MCHLFKAMEDPVNDAEGGEFSFFDNIEFPTNVTTQNGPLLTSDSSEVKFVPVAASESPPMKPMVSALGGDTLDSFLVDNNGVEIDEWLELDEDEKDLVFGESPTIIRSIEHSCVDTLMFERRAYQKFPNQNKKDFKDITHLILSGEKGGGFQLVGADDEARFLTAYAKDLESHWPHYIVEKRTPVFKFHCDLDIKRKQMLSDESVTELIMDLIKCVRVFYDATTAPSRFDVAVLRTFGGKKTGVHPIFPNLLVKAEQAMTIRQYFINYLMQKYGNMEGIQNPWEDVVDESVYKKNGLRMVGSHKTVPCPECKNKPLLQKHCEKCHFKGKLDIGRKYVPWKYFHNEQVDEEKTKQLLVISRSIQWCSIRSLIAEPVSGFGMPKGCNIPEYSMPVNKKGDAMMDKSGNPVLSKQLDTEVGTLSLLPEDHEAVKNVRNKVYLTKESERFKSIEEHVKSKAFPEVYRNVQVHNVFTNQNETYYQVSVRGDGSRFCHNFMKGNHNSNSIYFYITPGGIFQRCYCRCNTTENRRRGKCADFQSEPFILPKTLEHVLFPRTKSRVGKLTMEREFAVYGKNTDGHYSSLMETLGRLDNEIHNYRNERANELQQFKARGKSDNGGGGNKPADSGIRPTKKRKQNKQKKLI